MLTTDTVTSTNTAVVVPPDSGPLDRELRELLVRGFGVDFSVLDAGTGNVISVADGQPVLDWSGHAELCCEVARRGRGEFLVDEDPVVVFALPLVPEDRISLVAVAPFVTRPVRLTEDLSPVAKILGTTGERLGSWAAQQAAWPPHALEHVGRMVLHEMASQDRTADLEAEARSLQVNLSSTYEEISLLYRLTQNLKISESDEDLGRLATEWLFEVLPAAGVAMQLVPLSQADPSLSHGTRHEPVLLTHGDCPFNNAQFAELLDWIGPDASKRPMVFNQNVTSKPDWPCPEVRELIVVSLADGENHFGWLTAVNHNDGGEFGTVEASLLNSVAAILGIHSGNIELYRQRSELMAGIVRALTSAIDAKDPYTCGHSDRVARVAVRLAEELGCDTDALNTIYLSGLLHDIGKIGIDDQVLRKPGRLSDEEFSHIKGHVEIGYKILRDLGKLEDVLPVVLHHHESWDGGGYPHKLGKKQIPLPARIVAVADSYDAMCSDRPYRKGLPDEKIDQIFRTGSGQQWDPEVVDAFFRARDDIRRISLEEQGNVAGDLSQIG